MRVVSKPFDATTKFLVETDPIAWLQLAGLLGEGDPQPVVEVVDADLSTITAAADRVIRVTRPDESINHLEFQAHYDTHQDERVHWYHVALRYEMGVPVRSAVFLLRRAADGPAIRGEVFEEDGEHRLIFRYRVIRLWQIAVEEVLSGGLGVLPLALLANLADAEPAEVIQRMEERIVQEAPPQRARELWTATYVLMGLRYPKETTDVLLRGVMQMKESVTYQAILEEGRSEGKATAARTLILRLGSKRFGIPSEGVRNLLETTTSAERLQLWADRLLEAESWDELLTV